MEYYTPSKRWGKLANFNRTEDLCACLARAHDPLKSGLEHEEINFKNWFYPYFSMGYMPLWKDRFLHMPWVLELGHDLTERSWLVSVPKKKNSCCAM